MNASKRYALPFGAKPPRKPPLRSIKELAEEFGTSVYKLTYAMNADPSGPRVKLNATGQVRGKWYDPKEARAWWAKRKEAAAP